MVFCVVVPLVLASLTSLSKQSSISGGIRLCSSMFSCVNALIYILYWLLGSEYDRASLSPWIPSMTRILSLSIRMGFFLQSLLPVMKLKIGADPRSFRSEICHVPVELLNINGFPDTHNCNCQTHPWGFSPYQQNSCLWQSDELQPVGFKRMQVLKENVVFP